MIDDKKEKGITDIALVTYLVCEEFKIKRIEREDKNRSIFIFEKSEELEKACLTFLNREGKVEPLKFQEQLKNLKSYAKN